MPSQRALLYFNLWNWKLRLSRLFTPNMIVENYFSCITMFSKFLFNPISHELFSNWFPMGGGCCVSHHVKLIQNFLYEKICLLVLRASIADFGFDRHEFKSRCHQKFFRCKRNGMTKIQTHDLQIQSQLCLPLNHKFMKNA